MIVGDIDWLEPPAPERLATVVLLFDDHAAAYWVRDAPPRTSMSHDFNLFQFGHEARRLGARVFFSTTSDYYRGGTCREVKSIYPRLAISPNAVSLPRLDPDVIVSCHPQVFAFGHLPRAKKVGIHPALYFIEMPYLYTEEQTFPLLLAIRHHVDFLIVQNGRMADIAAALYAWLVGWPGQDRILTARLGIVPEEDPTMVTPETRARMRAEMGAREGEIVIVNGGGIWHWTGFNDFLEGFCAAVEAGATNLGLYMTGFRQTENTDHGAYIEQTRAILARHAAIAGNRWPARPGGAPRKKLRIHTEEDWARASARLPVLLGGADLGLNINRDGLENWQAQRVRCLDYIRHRLPILTTSGDAFTSEVAAAASLVLPGRTVADYRDALLALSKSPETLAPLRAALPRVRSGLSSTANMGRAVAKVLWGSKLQRPFNQNRWSMLEHTRDVAWQQLLRQIGDQVDTMLKPNLHATL